MEREKNARKMLQPGKKSEKGKRQRRNVIGKETSRGEYGSSPANSANESQCGAGKEASWGGRVLALLPFSLTVWRANGYPRTSMEGKLW